MHALNIARRSFNISTPSDKDKRSWEVKYSDLKAEYDAFQLSVRTGMTVPYKRSGDGNFSILAHHPEKRTQVSADSTGYKSQPPKPVARRTLSEVRREAEANSMEAAATQSEALGRAGNA